MKSQFELEKSENFDQDDRDLQELFKSYEATRMKEKWENFNSGNKIIKRQNGKQIIAESYSHLYFDTFKLNKYLNVNAKILQLGAGVGKFLEGYKSNYNIMAYDYSNEAIKALTKKNIPCRQVDMNDISATQSCLNLDIDSSPVNVIAIRTLQYLDDKALIALMFTLLNKTASNSHFILGGNVEDIRSRQVLTPNYLASFFGPRTDMKFSLTSQTPKKLENIAPEDHHDDEILVVKKL